MKDDSDTDERFIIDKLIDGDEDSFCRLYASYKNRIFYFISRFIKDDNLAQDITQDVFILLWTNRKFINPDKSFSSYLFTIVKNRVFNELRSLVRKKTYRDYILTNAKEDTNCTEDEIIANNLNEIFQLTASKLTERQKQIFLLSREDGLTNEEIANRLGISVNTVQYHICEALKAMRKSLNGYPECLINLVILYSLLNL